MTTFRSHYAADLGIDNAGETVQVAGWVVRVRDLGGILFFELRDASGRVQVVIDPGQIPEAAQLRMEYCVSISGSVRPRPEGTKNPDLETGMIEVAAGGLEILSAADVLPFTVDDRTEADERVRLQYRYLDLRRPRMAANLRARSHGIVAIRDTLDDMGFLDVETPTPDQFDAGGSTRLPRAFQAAAGTFLRAAAKPAAVQAAAHDLGR